MSSQTFSVRDINLYKIWAKLYSSFISPKYYKFHKMTSITVNEKEQEYLIDPKEEKPVTLFWKISSALFYAVCSFLITVINKSVLTSYLFPSFQALALGQMLTIIFVLFVSKKLSVVNFPDFQFSTFRELSPLPFIYLGNMIFGLGGTKELSLPMFTMLRRFSILMTMIAEYYILCVKPKMAVKVSVGLMIAGAVTAAVNDLGFNMQGYLFVLISDVLTASNGVYTKKILKDQKEMGKYGIMYYSALFMLPFSLFLIWETGDVPKVTRYDGWSDPLFLVQFALSCSMGFFLNYSVMLCTQYNSALTTTIIGCLKNILVTYLGMFIGGDYVYSINNFIGINLSVIGSLLYTYVTFKPPPTPRQTTDI